MGEDEDLDMAIWMSMQKSVPEPKRSKPVDVVAGDVSGDSGESMTRQRELMAAAAENRVAPAAVDKLFSSDPATSMGLVQHEGGPCGVLAAIQAFVLKYILFFSDELKEVSSVTNRV